MKSKLVKNNVRRKKSSTLLGREDKTPGFCFKSTLSVHFQLMNKYAVRTLQGLPVEKKKKTKQNITLTAIFHSLKIT